MSEPLKHSGPGALPMPPAPVTVVRAGWPVSVVAALGSCCMDAPRSRLSDTRTVVA